MSKVGGIAFLLAVSFTGCSAWCFPIPQIYKTPRSSLPLDKHAICTFQSRSELRGSRHHKIILQCPRMTGTSAAALANQESSLNTLKLFSPAKTNLFLRITRKRDDGFHELASVFQALGLGDNLIFDVLDGGCSQDLLSCNVASVPLDERNLVAKAFALFRKKTGVQKFFRCDIDKQTPLEGGMGGGSSNAATALWAANKLCGCPASEASLIEWGGELGSDVGFFLSAGTAYCTGRGEIVESLPPLPTPTGALWVVKPPEGCPTPAVYRALGLLPGQTLPGPDPAALRERLMTEGLSQAVCVNDLEPPAHTVLPKLQAIKAALRGGGFDVVLLSGSGATTFALDSRGGADPRAALRAAGVDCEGMLVQGPLRFVSRRPGEWYSA